MQTSTRSSKYLGSGLPDACSQHWSHSAAAAAPATQERLRNTKEASELSSHSLSLTRPFYQPSASHPRTPPARNSTLLSTSPTALIVAALVISRRRPGAPTMVSHSTWWGWRRKVFTLLGTACRRGLGILPGSRAQRALPLDFRLWAGKSAHPKTCDLQTPQRIILRFRCCSCLCAQIRRAPKIFWCTCENTSHR